MKKHRLRRTPLAPIFGFVALALASPLLQAENGYRQDNLVSDIPGLATHTDSSLVNPWGISSGPTSPFWVSDNGTGKSTLYNTTGNPIPLVVNIPGGVPTGQVFNGNAAAFNGDRFIFAGEDGSISGWRGTLGTNAEVLQLPKADSSYKGIALATMGTNTYLYAADFAKGQIAVIPSSGAPSLSGNFTDPGLPSGYSPFNIQNVGGSLYVAYAKTQVGSTDEVAGAGLGFVDKYDLNGNFLMRVASNGVLNAPWAVTLAPTSFGQFGGALLVGNFGDGMINAFDPTTGALVGTLKDDHGNPLVIEGLWGLQFGNGGAGGKTNRLYFAAGIDDEAHGLFGSLTPIPEPSTYAAGGIAILSLCVALRQRRRKQEAASTPSAA